MESLYPLYILLGALPGCSDDELRRAFLLRQKECHPDLNPLRKGEATTKSQQVNDAYVKLKNARHPVQGAEAVWFRVPDSVDLSDIKSRRSAFRDEWRRLQDNPSDVICALRLVHAAFQAERYGSVTELLSNPLVIDSAALLLSFLATEEALLTLRRWAQFLVLSQRREQAAQVMDDVFVTGKVPEIKEELRYLHYACAVPPLFTEKPPPSVRISHLKRAIELGFDNDRVHKHLAEAYHALGDDRTARIHLETAFQMNPALWGAVRISRALGMSPPTMPQPRQKPGAVSYKYDRPDQVPPPDQIGKWESYGAWSSILEYADLADYSWEVQLSAALRTVVEIAQALGRWRNPRSVEALRNLAKSEFERSWEVWQAATISLAKVGDVESIKYLRSLQPSSKGRTEHLERCIEYIEARLAEQARPVAGRDKERLLQVGQEAFRHLQYGRARFFFEAVLVLQP
jgi:tetratricopeptide (TPR) repeat protein